MLKKDYSFEALRTVSSGLHDIYTPINLIGESMLLVYPELSLSFLPFGYSLALIDYLIKEGLIHPEKNTKEVKEIRVIYDEIINNIISLLSIIETSNPIVINTIINHMVANGYLSKNHTFHFKNNPSEPNIYSIYGSVIMTSECVCRHIASLLTDVLKRMNFQACNLTTSSVILKTSNEANYSDYFYQAEKNYSYLTPEEKSAYLKSIKYVLGFIKKIVKDPNHLITVASDNKNSYLLDPTVNDNFTMSAYNSSYLYSSSRIAKIKLLNSLYFNSLTEMIAIPQILSLPQVPLEESEFIANFTKKMCNENKDLFEAFYKENKEAYNEIDDKLSRIRAK